MPPNICRDTFLTPFVMTTLQTAWEGGWEVCTLWLTNFAADGLLARGAAVQEFAQQGAEFLRLLQRCVVSRTR